MNTRCAFPLCAAVALLSACGPELSGEAQRLSHASADGGIAASPMPFVASGTTRYPEGRRVSPFTRQVVENLRAIAAQDGSRHDDLFMKVGDSITVDAHFLHCFAGPDDGIVLAEHETLRPTLEFFRASDAGGTSSFDRASLAAKGGKNATWAMRSADYVLEPDEVSPLVAEVEAISPRFALVEFGTNDLMSYAPVAFVEDLLDVVDTLTDRGIVPVLTTIPPFTYDAAAGAQVPLYNRFIRALAQARQIPLIDFWLPLSRLYGYGLWPDGIHPGAHLQRPCDFSRDPGGGYFYGQNQHNLLALEVLDRLRRTVVLGEDDFDDEPPAEPVTGTGTDVDPIVVPGDAFAAADGSRGVFVHSRDRQAGSAAKLQEYRGYCESDPPLPGPEVFYRLTVSENVDVWALLLSSDGSASMQLLIGAPTEAACVRRSDRFFTRWLSPGADSYLVIDGAAPKLPAERTDYLLLLVPGRS